MSPRDEWLLMSNMLLPPVLPSTDSEGTARDSAQFAFDLNKNLQLTRRAVTMGVSLAQIDGPLPVMDIVALVGVSVYTSILWGKFYTDYY